MCCKRLALLVILPVVLALAAPEARSQEPSEAFRESIRRTIELRKQRRRMGRPAVGRIEFYPMPPALIIRQTPEVHDEIGALLDLLRYGSR
jgi:hypothetical protein